MPIASIVGDFFFYGFLLLCMILACAKKLISAADADGQIKHETGKGVLRMLERFLK
jgi:hypothetical protein